jgi:hypothetical protein
MDSCTVGATTPVAWTEQTALGSPEQLFSGFAGTCQAAFQWDASGWGSTLTVVPPKGSSTIRATVELDTATARLATHTQTYCPDVLQIDGLATLVLPEGVIADHQPFTLSATAGIQLVSLAFTVKEASFGPWASVQKQDPSATLSMPITVDAMARGCSGHVGLSTQVVHDGMGSGAGGPLGSWSNGTAP